MGGAKIAARPSKSLFCCHCALPAGPQIFSDSSDALDNATHKLLTMKRYMEMSDEELKELQFVLLVELQNLVCCKAANTSISDLSARHSSLHCAGDKCPCCLWERHC